MASRLGGTLSRPLSCTVELGEVGVPEQPATQRGQQTIEGVPADVIQITAGPIPRGPSDRIALPASSALAIS